MAIILKALNEVTEYANQLGTAADMNTFIRSTGSVVPFSEIAINKTVYPNDVVARLDSVTINEVYGPYYNQADDSFNTSLRSSSDGVTNTSMYLILRVSTGCSKELFFLLYRSLISLFETVIVESLIEE